jgi:hypothetical protein
MARLAGLVEMVGPKLGDGLMGVVAGGAGHLALLEAGTQRQPFGV